LYSELCCFGLAFALIGSSRVFISWEQYVLTNPIRQGGFVRVQQSEPTQFSRLLQQSAETRMRAIQEKIAITFTFCATVELEIRFGDTNRAKHLVYKLHSTVNGLTAHINDPAHVSNKTIKQKFRRQLAQLRERVSHLHSHVEQVQSDPRRNLRIVGEKIA
jgi:hypothetical protein